MAGPEQIREVRDDPVVAGIDKQVVVELLDVLVERSERRFDGRQVRAQLIGRRLLGVARAINLRQALEEWNGGHTHAHSPEDGSATAVSVTCAAVTCSNSCGLHGITAATGRGADGSEKRPRPVTLHHNTPATFCR